MFHLDDLRVSAFRGIPGEVRLRLDAPLTLIYAPNGVGKTTICDAVEWLLTGRVQRLDRMMPQDYRGADPPWRCRFAQANASTAVEATAKRDDQALLLTRYYRDGEVENVHVGDGTSERQQWRPGALLKWLAPHGASDDLPASLQVGRRRDWLASTHFLSAERFGVLIDTDSRNQEARNELFADLLGVGSLQRASVRMERVADELRKDADRARASVKEHSTRVASVQEQIRESGGHSDLDTLRSSIRSLLAEVGLKGEGSDATDEAGLGKAITKAKEQLAQQQLSFDRDEPTWRTLYDELRTDIDARSRAQAAREELPHSRAARDRTVAELAALQKEAAARESERASDASRLKRLRDQVLTIRHATDAIAVFARAAGVAHEPLERVLDRLQGQRIPRLERSLEAANIALDQRDQVREWQRREQDLKTMLDGLASSDALRERLRRAQDRRDEVSRSRVALDRALSSFNSAAEQLSSLAHRLVHGSNELSECPLCGHDWSDPTALRNAIDALADRHDPRAQMLAERLDAIAAEERQAEASIQTATSQFRQREAATEELLDVQSRLREYRDRLRVAGFEGEPMPDGDSLTASVATLRMRISATEAAETLATMVPYFMDERGPCESTLAAAAEGLQKEYDDLALKARDALLLDSERADTLRALRAAIAEWEAQISSLRELVAEDEARRARIAATATTLGLTEPPSSDEIPRLQGQRDRERSSLQRARASLRSVEDMLSRLQRHELLEDLERSAQAARDEATRARRRHARACDAQQFAQRLLLAQQNERLGSIQRTVQSLFLRMHANRLFDGIEPAADALQFAARVAEMLFKSEELSQGQRQDLALAVFLARARMYGGTFIMDEPLLHLDDLNRLSLLDVVRTLTIQDGHRLRLLVTTASFHVFSHLQQKLMNVRNEGGDLLLRAYQLSGTAKDGVEVKEHRL